MKLERRKVNALTRQLENFKRKKLDEAIELEDKAIIEVPIIMGSQLKDMEKNKEHYDDVMKQNQDAIDEFKKDEEKNIKEAKDKWKGLVGKLEEEFKDLYLKEDNNYTVKCKGRKELRNLIEQCKESNVRYKWEKLIEGDYKYNVKFSLKEDLDDDIVTDEVVVDEQPIQEPTTQPEAINLDNLKLGDAIVVTQNLLDALMQTKASVEQMAETITNASEPITPNNEQEVFPVEQEVEQEQEFEIDENLKLKESIDVEGLKTLLQDYKDGKFELDSLVVDSDGFIQTDSGYYSIDLDESLKEGYYDVTVGELKEILNNALSKLKQMNDDETLDVRPNTYRIGNPYISIASKGFIDLAQLEDKSQTYYFIELNGNYYDSYQSKEEAIEIASQMYEDGEGDIVVNKDINDGYDVVEIWNNGELVENLKTKEQPKEQINEALQVVGSLEDYSPSPSAKPLYDEIVAEGMLEDLDKVLREIYQDGASIDELNNLLSTEKDFVKSMLGLDGTSDLEQEIEDETIEEIEKEDSLPASEKESEKNEYLNDETGYGEEEDEEDLSSLEAIVDSDEVKEM